jgi:Ni/Fe-hydrogenase subunit HybB-like protein
VHTVVSLDFASGILPGWHATIFPPYFVAGAIFSGFAMVVTLTVPLRKAYGLEDFITIRHLDNMGKIMLATGLIVAYGYFMEVFMGFYGGSEYETYMLKNRILTGPYRWAFGVLMLCNLVVPQLLWSQRIRRNPAVLWIIALVVNVGMWIERFVIIVTSLHRDFLPSAWGMYYPTVYDWGLYIGSLGLFFSLLFLFVRVLPAISVFEMRELVSRDAGEPLTAAGGAASKTGEQT